MDDTNSLAKTLPLLGESHSTTQLRNNAETKPAYTLKLAYVCIQLHPYAWLSSKSIICHVIFCVLIVVRSTLDIIEAGNIRSNIPNRTFAKIACCVRATVMIDHLSGSFT